MKDFEKQLIKRLYDASLTFLNEQTEVYSKDEEYEFLKKSGLLNHF